MSAGLPAKALPDANQPCTLVVKREVGNHSWRVRWHLRNCPDLLLSPQFPALLACLKPKIVQVTSSADGGLTRSRCYVNGAATSQRILRELGAMMVDANIQHSALALRYIRGDGFRAAGARS